MSRVRTKDRQLRAIFDRYGYDPDDPVRGRDIPDKLLDRLAVTPVVELSRFDRRERSAPSQRELEALELLACGYGYKEIAQKQGVQLATVQTRLKHVYAKLGAYNGPHAVALGIAHRLIPRKV